MRRTPVEVRQRTEPGCETCWKRGRCERAEDGKFCAEWQAREPEVKAGPDPNQAWMRGDPVDF